MLTHSSSFSLRRAWRPSQCLPPCLTALSQSVSKYPHYPATFQMHPESDLFSSSAPPLSPLPWILQPSYVSPASTPLPTACLQPGDPLGTKVGTSVFLPEPYNDVPSRSDNKSPSLTLPLFLPLPHPIPLRVISLQPGYFTPDACLRVFSSSWTPSPPGILLTPCLSYFKPWLKHLLPVGLPDLPRPP